MKPVRDLYTHETQLLNHWVETGEWNQLIIDSMRAVFDVDKMLAMRKLHTTIFMQGRYPNRPRDYFISEPIAGFHQYRLFEKTSKSYDFATHAKEFLNLVGFKKIVRLLLLEYFTLGDLSESKRAEEIKKFAELFVYAHVFMLWKGRIGELFFFDQATKVFNNSPLSENYVLAKTTQEFDGKFGTDFVIRHKENGKIIAGYSIKSNGYGYNSAVKDNGAHYEKQANGSFTATYDAPVFVIIFDPVADNFNSSFYQKGLKHFSETLEQI